MKGKTVGQFYREEIEKLEVAARKLRFAELGRQPPARLRELVIELQEAIEKFVQHTTPPDLDGQAR